MGMQVLTALILAGKRVFNFGQFWYTMMDSGWPEGIFQGNWGGGVVF